MESFILPPPIFPEKDGKDAPLDSKQPELDQNMEIDRDKTIEPPQPYDLAAMEARFNEYDQAAVEQRFNEFLRHYSVHSETTKPGDPIEDDDGVM